jgi:hypothetical protein
MLRIAQLWSCTVTQLFTRRDSPSKFPQSACFAGSWIPQLPPTDLPRALISCRRSSRFRVILVMGDTHLAPQHEAIPGRNVTRPGRRPSTPGRKNSSGQMYFNQCWATFWILPLHFHITTPSALHVHGGSCRDDYDEVGKVRKCSWPTLTHYPYRLAGKYWRKSRTS